MKFGLDAVKELIIQAESEPPTGDVYVDALYDSVVPIIGHTTKYYRLFYWLAKEFKPKFCVELGSWRGIASAHLAIGNPNGLVYTVDIHREDKVAQGIVREIESKIPNFHYINGWSWDKSTLDQIEVVPYLIDILFIDAWHTYDYAKCEWGLYEPMLAEEALVICDDIMDASGSTENMMKFWEELDYDKFLNTGMHDYIPMGFVRYVASDI